MDHLEAVQTVIRNMEGYVPGEQPKSSERVIKLNTNENPYPPPESVLRAIRARVDENLRRYPDPSSSPVRHAAARAYGFNPEQILVGNGSDDLLNIITRTFTAPGRTMAVPYPTYSLYSTMAAIQNARFVTVPWDSGGRLPVEALQATDPALVFVARPNSPSGHSVALEDVSRLCEALPRVAVVLDEAYADFGEDNGFPLLQDHPNLIVTRTFSKGQSLAGLRIGLAFTSPEFAYQMHKVRDSYNVDALAQAGAVAVLENLEDYTPIIRKIVEQRERLSTELTARGFQVSPSQGNFLLVKVPPGANNGFDWKEKLKDRGILVRYFDRPGLRDKLRISIGTPHEINTLLREIDIIQGL
jgi:histidinol-phosphate aminotransferase